MAINIKMTPIHHGPRLRHGLSLLEYTVAHLIYYASINPKGALPGWCTYSKKSIADFVGVSERKVFEIMNRLEGSFQLIERHPTLGFAKATDLWYEDFESRAGGMQNLQGDHAESAEEGMQNLQTLIKGSNKGNKNPLTPKGEQGALFGIEENKAPDKYGDFVAELNRVTGKAYRGDSKSRSKFAARLKDGYRAGDFSAAMRAAADDQFHRNNGYKYLTPEYLTREDQLQKWMNAAPRTEKAQENVREQKAKKAGIQY